jgi:L,D-transpeptidase catalytic domain
VICFSVGFARRSRWAPAARLPARAATLALVLVCLLGAASSLHALHALPALAAPNVKPVPRTQRLAQLLSGHLVHLRPSAASRRVAAVAALRPITGERTTLPVLAESRDARGIGWLEVMLPGRPNSSTGWISAQGTRRLTTPWRLVVHLGARRVLVYLDGKLVRGFGAVVGKASTPTPAGAFFVEETLRMNAAEPGGPFALALSARSDALREFEGGPGQIALHGRDGLGGTLGQAESHGCMRLATTSIDWLAQRIGPGVPVRIDRS